VSPCTRGRSYLNGKGGGQGQINAPVSAAAARIAGQDGLTFSTAIAVMTAFFTSSCAPHPKSAEIGVRKGVGMSKRNPTRQHSREYVQNAHAACTQS